MPKYVNEPIEIELEGMKTKALVLGRFYSTSRISDDVEFELLDIVVDEDTVIDLLDEDQIEEIENYMKDSVD